MAQVSAESIDVRSIEPNEKDWERAKGLAFYGSLFHGNNAPWTVSAAKMANAIKDKIKLVRRAKAIVAFWGVQDYDAPSTPGVRTIENVWKPFKLALLREGFSKDQVMAIENYKSELRDSDSLSFQDERVARVVEHYLEKEAAGAYAPPPEMPVDNAPQKQIVQKQQSNNVDVNLKGSGKSGLITLRDLHERGSTVFTIKYPGAKPSHTWVMNKIIGENIDLVNDAGHHINAPANVELGVLYNYLLNNTLFGP